MNSLQSRLLTREFIFNHLFFCDEVKYPLRGRRVNAYTLKEFDYPREKENKLRCAIW